jgi:ABC-type dipeptide/oligopeptide/nickel transport system permease component
MAIGIPVGLALGVGAALRRDSAVDFGATISSLLGLSIPVFWLALMLAWLFGVELQWLPFSGRLSAFSDPPRLTGLLTIDTILVGRWALFVDALRHLVLPAVTLASIPMALVARYSRTAFIEVLSQDYIRTAHAYGISPRTVIHHYAAKNAMLPLVTFFGLLVPALLSGTVLVETVFSWPGVGTLLLQSITGRDYPVIQSVTLVFALLYVLCNLLVDLSYGLLDPRTREQ